MKFIKNISASSTKIPDKLKKPTENSGVTIIDNRLKKKVFSLKYSEPLEKDMAIILVYFNTQQSLRIIQNLLYVKHMLDVAKIPYYIGEMSIQGSPYLFEESPTIFHLQSNDIMFYKEVIINLIEPRIDSKYTKLCMMDADILFDNMNWYALLSAKLNHVTICHPFNSAVWLNISYNSIVRTNESCLKNPLGHVGLVWAFQRDWFSRYKFPNSFNGGGDTVFKLAVCNKEACGLYPYLANYLSNYINALPANITSAYLEEVNVYHLYHGSLFNRQYVNRHVKFNTMLNKLHLSKLEDIVYYSEDGIVRWNPEHRDIFNAFMSDYLSARDDDSV
jgi:hypothetical protein